MYNGLEKSNTYILNNRKYDKYAKYNNILIYYLLIIYISRNWVAESIKEIL